jgi:hypothetical protein
MLATGRRTNGRERFIGKLKVERVACPEPVERDPKPLCCVDTNRQRLDLM